MTGNKCTTDSHLWNVSSSPEEDYWTAYESMRPKYSNSSFLDLIYDYHSSNRSGSSSFLVAHDVACGSGKAAIEISQRFQCIIASDINMSSLKALRQKETVLSHGVQYTQCAAEELDLNFAPQSADLITAAQCWPILDSAAALSSFAKVLKPGGTVAIWFYGRPHFSEKQYSARCQPLFDKILNLTFGKVIKGGSLENKTIWKKAADGMESWLDNMKLSTGQWNRIERRKWNSKSASMGFGADAVDFEIEPLSEVDDHEAVIEIEDSKMWEGTWDIAGVKKYVDYSFPGIKQAIDTDEQLVNHFKELEQAMRGEGVERSYTWPVVLVLASRL